ncbi:hypothetical protein OEZ85_011166 [Tetradesmus obliquus]|uniref:Uncharacterized protein n=1 Tax=Tetradesmus obliquus TaxID=3088 RepID=A0ABY8TRN9_TETOB|nr:hypothetical protein OEZ85_011166 [Tetradesmus obliquus]
MHTFTKQQRQGGGKYAARTLIGNWSEDVDLQAASLKQFMQKREAGSLKLDRYQQRMQTACSPVEMTKVRDDPYVHFGDIVQLLHVNTGCLLAVDVEDKEPVTRNTFLITKYIPSKPTPLEQQWADDVLRYGQRIRLLANPMAQGEPLDAAGGEAPLALYSQPLSVSCAAKLSRQQLVGFTWKAAGFDSVWQVQPLSPADQLACEGVEVAAGAPLLLVHSATAKPLNLEEAAKRPTDFGVELEVSANAVTSSGKQLALEHAARGETTRMLPKPHLSSNHWAFVTGSTVGSLPAGSQQAAAGLLERLLQGVGQQLQEKPGARVALEQKLARLAGVSGCMRVPELLLALRQVGCQLDEAQAAAIAAELAVAEEALAAAGAAAVKTAAGQVNMWSFLSMLDKCAEAE